MSQQQVFSRVFVFASILDGIVLRSLALSNTGETVGVRGTS